VKANECRPRSSTGFPPICNPRKLDCEWWLHPPRLPGIQTLVTARHYTSHLSAFPPSALAFLTPLHNAGWS
jgi:hypothetical protein